MRIGIGYDVHQFAYGRRLIIGGEEIPFEMGLLGHSDADVLAHSVIDALLGAACLGDIGKIFPDNNLLYKDADSINLLAGVCRIIALNGFRIINVDSVLVVQRPKLRPYIDSIQTRLRGVLGTDFVSVKATTEEGMGFTGKMEGISCQSVCLIEEIKPSFL